MTNYDDSWTPEEIARADERQREINEKIKSKKALDEVNQNKETPVKAETLNILSLSWGISIEDDNGTRLYKAQREGIFSNSWCIMSNSNRVATICRRRLSWGLTWDVHLDVGSFTLKRKVFSEGDSYYLVGSAYDGATMKRNYSNSKFEIQQSRKLFATVSRKFFTLRDRHVIEMLDKSQGGELLVVIFMTAMLLDRKRDRDINNSRDF